MNENESPPCAAAGGSIFDAIGIWAGAGDEVSLAVVK